MKSTEMTSVLEAATSSTQNQPLRKLVMQALENYFSRISSDMPPRELFKLVMEEVESPLMESTLKYTKGNQCKAAILLGISRSTLRKKLKIYGLD